MVLLAAVKIVSGSARCYYDVVVFFFFFKQKTAYEMCGRDWSSDVCSSDLVEREAIKARSKAKKSEKGSLITEARNFLSLVDDSDRKSVV